MTRHEMRDDPLGLRVIVPGIVTLAIVMLLHLPSPGMYLTRLAPIVPLVFAYFWAIRRPEASPVWMLALVGLASDLWGGGLIGWNVLMMLGMHYIVRPQREVFVVAAFGLQWVVFSVLTILAVAMTWAVYSIAAFAPLVAWELAAQAAITIAVYPMFHALYAATDRVFAQR